MEKPPERLANLTRDDARRRADLVSNVDYRVTLAFERGARGYTGRCQIAFDMARPEPVFLDFVGREVRSIVLNGQRLPPDAHRGHRIELPPLAAGRNVAEVDYACDYDVESVGLHHFRDPVDGCEYLYTDYEPHDANRVFPGFDQPDLKATFEVIVLAPPGWEVVSNTPPEHSLPAGERKRWAFAKTPRISTYLMNVCAGDYQVWTDPLARIPSRLLARKSLAPHVAAEELFEITRKGFDFYERYFEVPYPFGKYDQIFVPEFKTGAMENVGAVVITDNVLFRHQPTAEERVDRAILLLHEMAHMWFGNLVTMRWWDGLWLNESFATYMSFLAAEAVTDYRAIWPFFDARLRRWAVWQDELSTTHPIEMDVPETRGCFNNFDGITYGKGCCVLKQLVFRLGTEPFRRGVSEYLKQYSWQNTENLDFIRSLSHAAATDLSDWERAWLHASGVNTLGCEIAESGGKLSGLSIVQSPGNGDARLKEHRLRLGFFEEVAGEFKLAHSLEAVVQGERTAVDAARGLPAPAFIHPNLGFEAYAKSTLDPRSLAAAESGLARFADDGVRSGILDILRSMLMDAHLPAQRYLAIVSSLLPGEPSGQILDALSRPIVAVLQTHLPEAARREPAARLHALAAAELAKPDHTPGLRRIWFRYYLGAALAEPARAEVRRLLDGATVIPNLTLDQDMRWDLVGHLVRFTGEDALVAAESLRDATDRGERRALAIRAATPDPGAKRLIWERFCRDRETSLELLKAGFGGFHQPHQGAVLAPYAGAYLDALPAIARDRSMEFAMAFTESLFPEFHDEPAFMARLDSTLAAGTLPPALVRILQECRDDLQRLAKIRALARRT